MILSIIIPARNEFSNIVHTFHSIAHCLEADGFTPKDFEIIIVDNASNDDKYPQRGTGGTTSHLITRGGYWNRVLRVIYDPIAGNHSARNKGAEIARGEYLYFSDAHMALRPGFFKSILKTVDESGGLVHGTLQFMGAYPPTASGAGYGYTLKLGEEIKGCVDEQTEILTKNGWKKYNEVSMESEFVTVNPKTKEIEIQKPREIVKKYHNGEMYYFNGRSVDAFLTPYHRCPYLSQTDRHIKRNDWREKTAEKISKYDYLPLGTKGLIKNKELYSDELVELIGWIITEGSYDKRDGTITIVQYSQKNRDKIKNCLEKSNIRYNIHSKRKDFRIIKSSAKTIKNILPQKELTFKLLNKLNRKQLEKLYRVMIDADGTKSPTNESFVQVNETTTNSFQYLCILLGKQSKWYVKKPDYFKGNHFGKKDINVVSVKNNEYASGFKIEKKNYKGIVWCPDLPNGSIFTRRNGKTMPSFNTWNNYKIADNWFYTPAQGHWGVAVKKDQFLDFGGYPGLIDPKSHLRSYGGGEFYLDMKWWMFGSTVVTDPNAIGYHLAAGRGYSYDAMDYKHNVLNIAYALGMDDWRERAYINWLRHHNKDRMDFIMAEGEKEMEEDRKFIEGKRVRTFNEFLIERPYEKLNKEKYNHSVSGMLIYHDTILKLFQESPVAWEAYQKSKYQVGLDKFIRENLAEFTYKRTV